MSEEPTRAMPHGPHAPSHGNVGPADPTADPATQPSMVPVSSPRRRQAGESPTVPAPGLPPVGRASDAGKETGWPDRYDQKEEPAKPAKRSRSGVLWTGAILSAIVLLFLLIFIVQNDIPVQIRFLGFAGTLPIGVALLFSAIAGVLLVALPGGLRIMQLRRLAKRAQR